ncbi:exosortase family protein XrtF [Tamlana sp. I1]|uniref:exosortase family protein XrtF n=1 Tax=Tamlana sp. I1 TaxID=2762061 RepID=UPI00188F690B|nr:exosortase family protein XrtF [Tamlana sp. I1]
MKALFIKYKSVIKFMLTFLAVYVLLSSLYGLFLKFSDGSKFYPDYITHLVALQCGDLLEVLGYQVELIKHPDEPSLMLVLNGRYLARIIEGCNAFSVIILFISFVIAFSGKLKTTFFYVLAGSVLIYCANVLRIAVLSMGLYHFPKYESVLHNVIFPGIIYGIVFILWVFWVNRFSKLKQKDV